MGSQHNEAKAKDSPETIRVKEGRRNGAEDSLRLVEQIQAQTEGPGTAAMGPKRNIPVEGVPGSKGRFRQLHLQTERWSSVECQEHEEHHQGSGNPRPVAR